MSRSAVAYHVPAATLAAGDKVLIRSNAADEILNIFIDDETTIVCKMSSGEWNYFPADKEVRIAA